MSDFFSRTKNGRETFIPLRSLDDLLGSNVAFKNFGFRLFLTDFDGVKGRVLSKSDFYENRQVVQNPSTYRPLLVDEGIIIGGGNRFQDGGFLVYPFFPLCSQKENHDHHEENAAIRDLGAPSNSERLQGES